MINNTSLQRTDRIQAKSIDTQFQVAMQEGLNCSAFEAQIMVEKVHEIYGPLFDTSTTLQPGQIQMTVLDASVRPGVALKQAKQKQVTLTLLQRTQDAALQHQQGIPALRQHRLVRMAEEALQQGGLLTLEDLALLLNCGLRTLVGDLAVLRRQQVHVPLRSTVQDIGRTVSHRRLIVGWWLAGQEYSEIARRAHHQVSSVANYVEKYKRCVALLANGFDAPTTAFLARLSLPLVEEFRQLEKTISPAAHRQQELHHFLKKSHLAAPAPRRRP